MNIDFAAIKNRIFRPDPQIINELDVFRFRQNIGDSAYSYEDIYIDKDTFVDFLAIGTNGCFIIIPAENALEDEKYYREKIKDIRAFFGLNNKNSFVFLYNDEEIFFVSDKLIPVDDIYESFNNLYDNLLRPGVDVAHLNFKDITDLFHEPETPEEYSTVTGDEDPEYVRSIIPYEEYEEGSVKTKNLIDDIAEKCQALEGEPRPSGKQKVIDGVTYLYKDSDMTLGKGKTSIRTGFIGQKSWYPVSDEDPDRILLLTTIGGCFGVHKFYEGRFAEGFLYLITCGCMGVLPAIDIFLLIMGNAAYYVDDYSDRGMTRQKYYIRRPGNIMFATACIAISLVLGVILSLTIYRFIGMAIVNLAFDSASNMSTAQTGNAVQGLNNLVGN